MGDKAKGKKSGNRSVLRIALVVVVVSLLAVLALLAMMAFNTKNSDSPVGYWDIREMTSGETVMTAKDAESLGLTGIGYFRMKNSGTCEVKVLNIEVKGTWKQAEDGTITIDCGEAEGAVLHTITASISEDGVMSAKDDTLTEYKLKK